MKGADFKRSFPAMRQSEITLTQAQLEEAANVLESAQQRKDSRAKIQDIPNR